MLVIETALRLYNHVADRQLYSWYNHVADIQLYSWYNHVADIPLYSWYNHVIDKMKIYRHLRAINMNKNGLHTAKCGMTQFYRIFRNRIANDIDYDI